LKAAEAAAEQQRVQADQALKDAARAAAQQKEEADRELAAAKAAVAQQEAAARVDESAASAAGAPEVPLQAPRLPVVPTNTSAYTAKAMAEIDSPAKPIPPLVLGYKVAVFTTTPNTPHSLSTLSLLREMNAAYTKWDFFLLGNFSAASVEMAKHVRVRVTSVAGSAFNRSDGWKFDWVYGPEHFHEMGYDLSLYVDGEAISAMRQFDISEVVPRLQLAPMAAVDFANWPKERGNFNMGVMWFNNSLAHSQRLASRFVDTFRRVPRWPQNGAHLLLDAMWVHAAASRLGPIALDKQRDLQHINISALPPSWNVDCHGLDCHDVDCRGEIKDAPSVDLAARKFVYDTGPYMFHFTKYNDGYCTSKPHEKVMPNFFDAIHEKAWHLWSDRFSLQETELLAHSKEAPSALAAHARMQAAD
jgi:hypothetical protein